MSGGRGGVMTVLWGRGLCSADRPVGPVAYEQVKKLLVARTGVLIDVREPWELREYGAIPGAINVPCESLTASPYRITQHRLSANVCTPFKAKSRTKKTHCVNPQGEMILCT